ncbi:MAG: Fic family protein [Propionibacteriaceae bacterium]|nr:Fic family protein [Propionibacteriaceae bacterium]
MIPEFFTHQDAWFDQVGRIYALLHGIQTAGNATPRLVELRRKNRISSIHSSTAIEGNRLTLGEVTAVVDGHAVYGPAKDVLEVQNAWAAYEALDTFDPSLVDDFLRAHGMVTQGLIAESGQFRTMDVEIVNADGEVLHTGSQVAKVPRLIGELFEWAASTTVHPLIASCATHFMIEYIHPFQDGNGRLGRLWQTLMLSRWEPLFAWMPTETLIARNQVGYYTALRDSQESEIDGAPFITFMLSVIEQSLAEYQTDVGVNVGASVGVNERVLSLIRHEPHISAARLAERLGMSSRQVERIVKAWRDQGVLAREGSAKTGRWIVRDSAMSAG